ncbi:hypothetical protein JB92DRAFT_3115691 [Gautieria morchelliformis]|nr:hypothetical protein JB92DRAFT_3115691 [Gautieria morchelliformis]
MHARTLIIAYLAHSIFSPTALPRQRRDSTDKSKGASAIDRRAEPKTQVDSQILIGPSAVADVMLATYRYGPNIRDTARPKAKITYREPKLTTALVPDPLRAHVLFIFYPQALLQQATAAPSHDVALATTLSPSNQLRMAHLRP